MKLRDMLKQMGLENTEGNLEVEITGIAHDSRKVQPGYLFVCVEGFKSDGHDFIEVAAQSGAVAFLVQKEVPALAGKNWVKVTDTRWALADVSAAFYDFPATKMNVIGITGTNGKTTTTHLVKAILEAVDQKVGLIGTIHNIIDNRSLPVSNTTPLPLELQEVFHQMVQVDTDSVVMEVSSHALDLGRVANVEYDVAVFTNITQDHLDYHETMEKYLEAKTKLFSGLAQNGIKKRPKYAIINKDDSGAAYIVERSGGQVITYGIKNLADVRATNINIQASGVSFIVEFPGGSTHLDLKMTGMFSVYNALAAFSVGLCEQVPVEKIKGALEGVSGVAGRFELVDEGQDFAVIVDYAHTPDSLENVLKTAQEFAKGRIISVFGCGGDRDRTKRPIMAAVSGRLADFTIITSDNPRSEDPEQIVLDVEAGIKEVAKPEQYTVIVDRAQAIRRAVEMALKDDIVIIAGKGHETYQILKEETIHFDDREVAAEVLKERK